MKTTKFSFPNGDGVILSAQMEWPADQQPHSYAIFAHCFTCGKNLNTVRNISKILANRGVAVLSFDWVRVKVSLRKVIFPVMFRISSLHQIS